MKLILFTKKLKGCIYCKQPKNVFLLDCCEWTFIKTAAAMWTPEIAGYFLYCGHCALGGSLAEHFASAEVLTVDPSEELQALADRAEKRHSLKWFEQWVYWRTEPPEGKACDICLQPHNECSPNGAHRILCFYCNESIGMVAYHEKYLQKRPKYCEDSDSRN